MDSLLLIIKKLRKFRGITQEAIAEKLHLSLRAYQKIESGNTRIDTYRLEQIAEVLGVSVSDLVNAKFNAERHLLRSRSSPKVSNVDMQEILEEWAGRLLYVLIKAKNDEVNHLQKAVEEGF